MINNEDLKQAIRRRGAELGFAAVGFTTAEPFPEAEAAMFERLGRGMLAGLQWFTPQRIEASCRPQMQLPQARTLISLAMPYSDPLSPPEPDEPPHWGMISRYARGPDYHRQIRQNLAELISFIGQETGRRPAARTYVDSGWLAERAAAVRAGLGFIGKNTNLIVPGWGSWVLLGEVLLDLPIASDTALEKDCGNCDLCLRACPTGALRAPYELDANHCLSFLTIEWRGAIPRSLRSNLGRRVFGCDACQDVCPWNNGTPNSGRRDQVYLDSDGPFPRLTALLTVTETSFRRRFGSTALARTKRTGLQRNAAVVAGNLRARETVPALIALLEDPAVLIRQHAAWALGQIGGVTAEKSLFQAYASEEDDEVRVEIEFALDVLQSPFPN